jgi:DNA-directed RNA polymerase subunit RPC12/RpoP
MNTKLSAVSDKHMELTCSACGHEFSYKIADLILATSDDTTTDEVRQRAVCRGCGVRGDNHLSGAVVGPVRASV